MRKVLTLLFLILLNQSVFAFNPITSEGHFVTLKNYRYYFLPNAYVRLSNGKYAIVARNAYENDEVGPKKVIVFDPKTNEFSDLKTEKLFPDMLHIGDDKFLYEVNFKMSPAKYLVQKYKGLVEPVLIQKFEEEALKKIYSDEELNKNMNDKKAKKQATLEARDRIKELSKEEILKYYIPILKEHPKEYNDYLKYAKEYEAGNRLDIYDLKTDTTESVYTPSNMRVWHRFALKDGRVFLFGENPDNRNRLTVFFNPKTKKFKEVKNIDEDIVYGIPEPGNTSYPAYTVLNKTSEEKILFLYKRGYVIFDVKSEQFYARPFPVVPSLISYAELDDGKLVCLMRLKIDKYTNKKNVQIFYFEPKTNEITFAGYLKVKRKGALSTTLLKNGKILILGGNKPLLGAGVSRIYKNTKKAEIFDTKTWEIKQIVDAKYPVHGHSATIPLDDGRVLINDRSHHIELFIPEEW